MRSRRMLIWSAALLTVACGLAAAPWLSSASAALMVLGPLYTWTGDAPGNNDWDDEDNWDGPAGYPSSTAHGAVFPDNSGSAWSVDLTSETIDVLTVEEDVDFDCTSLGLTLEVNAFVIDATCTSVSVTVCSGATIATP